MATARILLQTPGMRRLRTKHLHAIYWIATLLFIVPQGWAAVQSLIEAPRMTHTITQLGYPEYFLIIIGIWKVLGVIAILVPRYPLVKEWAYAGFFFTMTGAIFSHVAVGDPFTAVIPAILLSVLTVVSWYFRPTDKKLVSTSV